MTLWSNPHSPKALRDELERTQQRLTDALTEVAFLRVLADAVCHWREQTRTKSTTKKTSFGAA